MSTRRLLRVPAVRTYLIGQSFSLVGDSALWLAMGIWVKSLTGSSAAAGLVFFFFTAPSLLGPAVGLLVDRVRRKPLLIVTNLAVGCTVLLLQFVNRERIWLVYAVMALYGLAYAVLGAAQSALLKTITPDELLADANGILRTVQESLRLVGPLLGSGLFVLAGARTVVLLDAATFVVPVISLLLMRIAEPAPRVMSEHWRIEVTAGVRYVGRSPLLRQVVAMAACAMAVFGFTETVIFAVAGQGLHRPPAFVGVIITVQGIGALLGGPSAAPLSRRIGERRLMGLGLAIGAAGAALEIPPSLPSVLAGAFLFGISIPWMIVGFVTLLQKATPDNLQGRVYAAATTIVSIPQTLSIALGAALINLAGYRLLLLIMALVVAMAAAPLLTPEGPLATEPHSPKP